MKKLDEMILCIDPSTTCIGYSLFYKNSLEDFGACKVPVKIDPIEKLLYIRNYFREYVESKIRVCKIPVTYVFIEESFISFGRGAKKGALLVVVGDMLKELFKILGAEVYKVHNRSIKKVVAGNGGASKVEVAKVIIQEYPEIRNVVTKSEKSQKYLNTDVSDSIAIYEYVKRVGFSKIKYKK